MTLVQLEGWWTKEEPMCQRAKPESWAQRTIVEPESRKPWTVAKCPSTTVEWAGMVVPVEPEDWTERRSGRPGRSWQSWEDEGEPGIGGVGELDGTSRDGRARRLERTSEGS